MIRWPINPLWELDQADGPRSGPAALKAIVALAVLTLLYALLVLLG